MLPLLPEAAPELLALLNGHRGYNELELLHEHAALLWRHARAAFVARANAVLPMFSPVELFANAARGAPVDERTELRALAMAALEREDDPIRRGQALLAWAPLEPPAGAAAMIAEALDIVRSAPTSVVSAIIGRFADRFDFAQRAAVRAIAARPDAARHAAQILMMLARVAPPGEALADARAALERGAQGKPADLRFTIFGALEIVPFEVVQPWLDPWFATIDNRRDLCFAACQIAPWAPAEVLDRLLDQADAIGVELWARAEILGDVAPHHAARRDELRDLTRDVLARVVGDVTLGHHMEPEDIPDGANPVVLQVCAIARASAVLAEEARELQRRVLARVAEMPSDFDDRHDLDSIPWADLGGALDPALRAEAVRAVLALRYRPSALKALGEMVARFPVEARHLALHGLSRLTEATPPEPLARVILALERARSQGTVLVPARSGGRDAPAPRSRADERLLAALRAYLTSDAYVERGRIEELTRALSGSGAQGALDLVAGIESPFQRCAALIALAGAPGLAGTPEREAALASALSLVTSESMMTFEARELSQMLGDVRGGADAIWAERIAALFDARATEREPYLDLIEAFAPLLYRLGGAALVTDLVAALRGPPPIPEFARPWRHASRVTFDA